ncbi:MAG TPA: DNA-3-methyladenine glycosylase [Bacteroidia bacterium]|nr:DNA-3-methyladenine glycosylase [Bacteroidia bacterium]MBP7714593.1 DNA-3-methyladenine glycosylase [Bacteroidia bacterium]MBP8667880.1 DNA-3-methyladenine glycosylase [Bacteroidia bacterium]HOZ81386.1 DNA-3-methyladenine glycosylase [Bacteroidia bacterium]HQW16938.1 DNA-3-methyladenine glycosylase [Bacteroidia bacterium]
MSKLLQSFYLQESAVKVARQLLGKELCTKINGKLTSGIITETEAYMGVEDKASHAWNNRRTQRTEIMYRQGGVAYVYLCYGIHSLFNVVTNIQDVPHAVLIRSIFPKRGFELIKKRRPVNKPLKQIASGPGMVSQALGIDCSMTGTSLLGNKIWIENNDLQLTEKQITTTVRIGVDYAGNDAMLPYRFLINPEILN